MKKTSRRRTRRGLYGLVVKRPTADTLYHGGHSSKGTSTASEKDLPIPFDCASEQSLQTARRSGLPWPQGMSSALSWQHNTPGAAGRINAAR